MSEHPLSSLIVDVLGSMQNDDSADDIAILALRRRSA